MIQLLSKGFNKIAQKAKPKFDLPFPIPSEPQFEWDEMDEQAELEGEAVDDMDGNRLDLPKGKSQIGQAGTVKLKHFAPPEAPKPKQNTPMPAGQVDRLKELKNRMRQKKEVL